jgi:hypothetical protein
VFVQELKPISLQEGDILVSSDVLLFTEVQLEDTMQLLSQHLDEQMVVLVRHVLTTMYFLYNGSFYDQKDGVTMRSPLAPVVANFYMEHFEQQAISSTTRKSTWWYRYVDDTFVVWPHGKKELYDFLQHLNNIHPNIKFTTEVEQDGSLAFLDVLVSRRLDGSLGHSVHRKQTHAERYLHANSEHHLAQKQAVLMTLVRCSITLCNMESLGGEIRHLKCIFQRNGYNKDHYYESIIF